MHDSSRQRTVLVHASVALACVLEQGQPTCVANRRTRFIEKPWKLFDLISSYLSTPNHNHKARQATGPQAPTDEREGKAPTHRLMHMSSKEMQRWPRK